MNCPNNEKKLQNSKLIEKLLLTVTVADPEQFTCKSKLVTYTETFVEFYNQENNSQIYGINEMIELKK